MASGWSERAGEKAASTHGGRIAIYAGMLLLGLLGTIWLVADPDALSGVRGAGLALGPVLIVLALLGLVREMRTGDTRVRPGR